MANGSIKIIGLKKLQTKMSKVAKVVPHRAAQAINDSIIFVEKEMKNNLTNKLINVGKTGLLRKNWVKIRASTGKLIGILGTNTVYARIHEFGGRAGRNRSVKLRARKYLQTAIKDSQRKINKILDNAMKRIVRA